MDISRFLRHGKEVLLLAVQAAYRLDMSWDNSVNKKVIIYAVSPTVLVEQFQLSETVEATT